MTILPKIAKLSKPYLLYNISKVELLGSGSKVHAKFF